MVTRMKIPSMTLILSLRPIIFVYIYNNIYKLSLFETNPRHTSCKCALCKKVSGETISPALLDVAKTFGSNQIYGYRSIINNATKFTRYFLAFARGVIEQTNILPYVGIWTYFVSTCSSYDTALQHCVR